MNIFFIISLFILFFSILQGWRKRLLGLVVGFVSWIFVFVFVSFANPYVEQFIRDNTHVYDKIYEKTQEYVQEKLVKAEAEDDLEEWWTSLTKDIPKIAMNDLQTKVSVRLPEKTSLVSVDEVKQEITNELVQEITNFIMRGIAILASFVIAEILVGIVLAIVNVIGKLPVIRGVNNFLGIIAGAVEGFLVIWFLMYMVSCACSTSIGQMFLADINSSTFLSYLYQHNLIFAIFSTI